MIIFTSNPNIITEEYLLYKKINPRSVLGFNLSSSINIFTPLQHLFPIQECLPNIVDDNIDYLYSQYVASNVNAHMELLRIINNSYLGGISIVLIDNESPYRQILNELVSKIISVFYGYPVVYAEDTEDLYYASEPEFSIVGILNFDKDRFLLESNDFREEMIYE